VIIRTADCDYQYPGFAVIRPSYRDHLYPTVTSSASYCDYQYPQFTRVYQPHEFRSARGFFARHRPAASPCSSCRAAPSSTIGVCSSPRVSSAVSARFALAGTSCREAPWIAGRVILNSDDTRHWADWQSAASTYQRSFLLNSPSASAGARNALRTDEPLSWRQRLEQSADAEARWILKALKFHEDHQTTKQRDDKLHKSCVDLVQWDGRCHSLLLKAVDQLVGVGGGGRSNACVDFVKGRCAQGRSAGPLLPPRAEALPAMGSCVGSRARTGCRLKLPVRPRK
jgi:hypothetical protein